MHFPTLLCKKCILSPCLPPSPSRSASASFRCCLPISLTIHSILPRPPACIASTIQSKRVSAGMPITPLLCVNTIVNHRPRGEIRGGWYSQQEPQLWSILLVPADLLDVRSLPSGLVLGRACLVCSARKSPLSKPSHKNLNFRNWRQHSMLTLVGCCT